MHALIWRGLQTAVLTGGFLALGTGIASADENDVSVDVAGLTATVPVEDGAVLDTPVVTGTGEQLTVLGGATDPAGGVVLPVDTDDDGNTTVLGDPSGGGISVPITVTEADGSPPDPQDGLTATVPVNTSDGDEDAGTTVVAPIVTGNLGDVLDRDPTTGNDVDVHLDGLVVGGDGNLLLDVADLGTIGGSGDAPSRETVLSVPVSADRGADTTVTLPVRTAGLSGEGLLSGNDVDVTVGGVLTDGSADDGRSGEDASDPVLSLPVDTGGSLGNGDVAAGNTVEVHLGGLLTGGGAAGPGGNGSVVTVPVDEGAAGAGRDNLVAVTLPARLGGSRGDGTDVPQGASGTGGVARTDRTAYAPATGPRADRPFHARSGTGARPAGDAGRLAWTGADPLLPALAGALALGAGLVLTRAARRRRPAM